MSTKLEGLHVHSAKSKTIRASGAQDSLCIAKNPGVNNEKRASAEMTSILLEALLKNSIRFIILHEAAIKG